MRERFHSLIISTPKQRILLTYFELRVCRSRRFSVSVPKVAIGKINPHWGICEPKLTCIWQVFN